MYFKNLSFNIFFVFINFFSSFSILVCASNNSPACPPVTVPAPIPKPGIIFGCLVAIKSLIISLFSSLRFLIDLSSSLIKYLFNPACICVGSRASSFSLRVPLSNSSNILLYSLSDKSPSIMILLILPDFIVFIKLFLIKSLYISYNSVSNLSSSSFFFSIFSSNSIS